MPNRSKHLLGRLPQRTFDHLLSKAGRKTDGNKAKVPTRLQTQSVYVKPKDRIPLWNFSSGDRVRIIAGDSKGKLGTVDWVDRSSNRVYLMEPEFCHPRSVPTERKNTIFKDPNVRANQSILVQVPIHYSNIALLLERRAALSGSDNKGKGKAESSLSTGDEKDIVAKRLRATDVHYDYVTKSWKWKRLAEATSEIQPETGHLNSVELQKVDRFTKFIGKKPPPRRAPAPHDLSVSSALQQTYFPSLQPLQNLISSSPPSPTLLSPSSLFKTGDGNSPIQELRIRDMEFNNVYGRAARTKRFREKKELKKALKNKGQGEEATL